MKILEIKDCLSCPCRDETPSTVSGPNYVSWCEQAGKEICWWEPKDGEIPEWCPLPDTPNKTAFREHLGKCAKDVAGFPESKKKCLG